MPMIMNRIAAALICAATGAPSLAATGAEQARWYVLRGEKTGDCWTAKVAVIAGQLATGSALAAGGPYETEAEAEVRLEELRLAATCR